MQELEAEWGQPMDEILRELYVGQRLTVDQVGRRLGVTKGAASRWLERFGVATRKPGRAA